MYLKEYIKQSERTMSDKGFRMNMLHASLGIVTETAELLDAYKKNVFYGKDLDLVNIKEEIGDIFWYLAIVFREIGLNSDSLIVNLTNRINFTTLRKEGIHNKINVCYVLFISSNNLARTLYSHYFLDKNKEVQPLTDNIINLVDKTILDILKFCYFHFIDLEEILQTNINKLAKRYPDKFDSNLALNRDLKAEREVLEGLNTKTEQVDYNPNNYKAIKIGDNIEIKLEGKPDIDDILTPEQEDGLNKFFAVSDNSKEPDISELHEKGLFAVVNSDSKFSPQFEINNDKKFKEHTPEELRNRIEKGLTQMVKECRFIDEIDNDKVLKVIKKALLKDVDNSGIDSRVPKVVNDGL